MSEGVAGGRGSQTKRARSSGTSRDHSRRLHPVLTSNTAPLTADRSSVAPYLPRRGLLGSVEDRIRSALWRESSLKAAARRTVDIAVAATVLLLLSPLLLIIAVVVKLDSPGPIIYRQVRIGRDERGESSDRAGGRRTADLGGRPFLIYKFRTMHQAAEKETGPTWASKTHDRRTTGVGQFLRNYALDEIPQFWNVLKGDMSLVGPRPERPRFVNRLRERVPGYELRQTVRPGITGWAQIHQGNDQSVHDVHRKVHYDLEYIEKRSLWLDLKILFRTPLAVVNRAAGNGVPEGGGKRTESGSGKLEVEEDAAKNADGDGGPSSMIEEEDVPPGQGEESNDRGDETDLMLVASAENWFVAAIRAVANPVGIKVVRAQDVDETIRRSGEESPDVVLLDERLPGGDLSKLCATLSRSVLSPDVPIVVYSPRLFAYSETHARALDEGAWAVIREPLRAGSFLALIRRLVSLGRRLEPGLAAGASGGLVDPETGLLSGAGLMRVVPSLGALAQRNDAPLSCVVVGPTDPGSGEERERRRVATAELCSPNVRNADVCGWMDGDSGVVVIVAYDTPADGAEKMARRLNRLAAGSDTVPDGGDSLSVGIVELKPGQELADSLKLDRVRAEQAEFSTEEFVEQYRLTAARSALDRARAAGGGIEIAAAV